MRKVRQAALLVLLIALAVELLWAWPWSRDMFVQSIVRPLLMMFAPPPGTVALGSEAPLALEAADRISRNPLVPSPENVEAGRKLYTTYCAVCHGVSGKGDGPVAGGALAPANLTSPLIQQKSDGHFEGVMRNGIRTMPQYHEGLSRQERWQVVLYVRALAQKSP